MISPEAIEALVLAVLGVAVIQMLWLVLLTYSVYKEKHSEQRKASMAEAERIRAEERTVIEDIFLLHRSGLLLKHYTRRLRPNVDSDVLSGMLVAVQEFVKDSFRGEKGVLNEIRFGELRITVLEGKWTIVACLVRGERLIDIQPQITAALYDLECKYGDLLMNWDGTLDATPDVDVIMRKLISGGYRDAILSKAPHIEPVLVR